MFPAEPETPRPAGKPGGYDYSQRCCGTSDTSKGYQKISRRGKRFSGFFLFKQFSRKRNVNFIEIFMDLFWYFSADCDIITERKGFLLYRNAKVSVKCATAIE